MKFGPYSHSRISAFYDCQQYFKLKYIDKIKVNEYTPYFEKGKFFHYVLEHFPKLPPKKFKIKNKAEKQSYIETIKKLLEPDTEIHDLLVKHSIKREQPFHLDIDGTPLKKKKGSTFTGVIDYIGQKQEGELLIIDWKTGQSRASNNEQVKLYALWAFNACPNIKTVKCTYYYLEQTENDVHVFDRESKEELMAGVINRVDTIESCEIFEKKFNKKCDYCAYFNICKPLNQRMKTDEL